MLSIFSSCSCCIPVTRLMRSRAFTFLRHVHVNFLLRSRGTTFLCSYRSRLVHTIRSPRVNYVPSVSSGKTVETSQVMPPVVNDSEM